MKPLVRSFAQSLLFALPLSLAASPVFAAPDDPQSVDEGFAGPQDQEGGKKNKKKNRGKKKSKKDKKGKKGKKHKKAHKRGGSLCGPLSCTDEQREKVAKIMQRADARTKSDRTDMQALHTALGRELAKETPSTKELERIRKDLERRRAAQSKRTFAAMLEIHAVLEPEQRERLAQLIERRGAHRVLKGRPHGSRGKGPRGGRPRGPDAQRGLEAPPPQ